MQQCSSCRHYEALKTGEPPAGWCQFIINADVPFWMARDRLEIDKNRADVLATDGANCDAFEP
jgi:hypothetical protein